MVRVHLSPAQEGLLRGAVARWAPELLVGVSNLSARDVSHTDRLALVDAVVQELASQGVGPDGEINSSGKLLDNLVSALKPSDED